MEKATRDNPARRIVWRVLDAAGACWGWASSAQGRVQFGVRGASNLQVAVRRCSRRHLQSHPAVVEPEVMLREGAVAATPLGQVAGKTWRLRSDSRGRVSLVPPRMTIGSELAKVGVAIGK